MAKNGYTINKSNYTIKKFHQNTSKGGVYERDFMATTNLGGWDSGSFPDSEHNFKMVHRDKDNPRRMHYFGDFLPTPAGGSTVWTLGNIQKDSDSDVTSESRIVINPDYTSLLSFAYYGSCTELIKSTIKHIIDNFPAKAFSTNRLADYIISESGWYILYNPFDIDLVSAVMKKDGNPFRYFCESFSDYLVFQYKQKKRCVSEWTTERQDCHSDYDFEATIKADKFQIIVRRYKTNGGDLYVVDKPYIELKPNEELANKYFNTMEDFERVLLNRNSSPKYTAVLDFPHETERGIETYTKTFTWPMADDWNIDISSLAYEDYVKSLLKLAQFYDEYYSDNLWKMMTHDAIKNMDITYTRPMSDEDKEDYNYGTTKMQGLMWGFGRQFDELKRAIENISSVNRITYDKNNNIPDYFLTDVLNLSGWEISNSVEGLNTKFDKGISNSQSIAQMPPASEANVIFLKNLKINSKSILSRKGTRYGIEMVLGLFGMQSDDFKGSGNGDYTMTEGVKVATVKNNVIPTHTGVNDVLAMEKYNEYKVSAQDDASESAYFDPLEGLPAVIYYYEDGSELRKTVIPWFKEPETLDGNPYFQMYGGWEKIGNKYGETICYLHTVANANDLLEVTKDKLYKLEGGEIFFVYDVSDYNFGEEPETHYFELVSHEHSQEFGGEGWNPIYEDDEEYATKIKYIRTIIDDYRGNNPHIGYGNYDDGNEYLEYFKQIFKGAIESDELMDAAYDCSTEEIISAITEQGFTLSSATDNKKVWFFYDKDEYGRDGEDKKTGEDGMKELTLTEDKTGYESKNMGYDTSIGYGKDVRNLSNDKNIIHSEPSIVNVKDLTITFRTKSEEQEKYIEKAVLPYLRQVVPSTALLKIEYSRTNS